MDKAAQKLASWFGSLPFIIFHFVWFTVWILLHIFAKFDQDWSSLTLIVSLEAIFLSLFILRAENVESTRQENKIKTDIKTTKEILKKLDGRTKR